MSDAAKHTGLVTPENYLVREEPIRRLEKIIFALWAGAGRSGEASSRTRDALRLALSARCARCGMQVSGEELIVLSQLPANRETDRIQRLRQGRCAREACKFEHYHLAFLNHPDLNWPQLLSAGDTVAESPTESAETTPGEDAEEIETSRPRRRALVRIGILLAIVVLVFIFRQMYFGGRIPMLREPEKFRVDPAPPGQEKVR